MKIIPMRDLKNTVEVERQCKEEQGPIFVTKNGYGRLVVMDIEYYESTIQKMEEARLLIEALEDVEEGRVLDGKEALLKLREKYGI
ncbi:MAG: type II toxin-antitoxin system Phd/YefM family antitoxin [Granulicatella sp.]|jgi:prevent-host-death family protein|uniref:type II toxin-antitoxin system Phd/YefM family antitoxin n=1 Tax=Streptococcus sp. 263_SSPC TaxID=1579343 RepID=UPI00065FCC5B|nr:type II toxin-antitoxin system Phd/YefM family antitoxin [Streptococcus sp. 263_SSPC]MBF1210596.1 type II toxin-antitoxin system Phd/YefM family antitoxin [Granulicatella sp.]MCP9468216.1 type II toxin-antitoxin system Phd/YefM family antitoxin [Candidatus Granulicatella sp. P6S_S16_bin.50.1]MDO4872762.1 type II toxin-antitoxin system Phd/YefM family antitoxin [Carnobacterium sp.]